MIAPLEAVVVSSFTQEWLQIFIRARKVVRLIYKKFDDNRGTWVQISKHQPKMRWKYEQNVHCTCTL